MPLSDPALWAKIRDWPLPYRSEWDNGADPPRQCNRFEHNLRQNGDWTDVSADRITAIYRQFLYLKALNGGDVTPSTFIDAAWHLHLEFAENYAALCKSIGRNLVHRTDMTYAECQRAHDIGLALYAAEFDRPAARDLWPSGQAQHEAEKLFLAMTALGIVAVVVGILGAVNGAWVAFIALVPLVGLGRHLVHAWGGTSPETMSRCG